MLTLAAGSLLFMLDVASKHVVRRLPRASYGLMPGLQVTRVQLARADFSQTRGKAGLVLTWLVAMTCAAILVYSGRAFETPVAQVGVGAALGGALGNLLDVLRRQAITDFLDLGWWPVFNLADVGIVGGLVFAFWPLV
jgi:signal peptidase II